jgi:thiaminase
MWIDTYSGIEFSNAVNIMLNITQQAISDISPNSNKGIRLLELFKLSSELELFFWNDS